MDMVFTHARLPCKTFTDNTYMADCVSTIIGRSSSSYFPLLYLLTTISPAPSPTPWSPPSSLPPSLSLLYSHTLPRAKSHPRAPVHLLPSTSLTLHRLPPSCTCSLLRTPSPCALPPLVCSPWSLPLSSLPASITRRQGIIGSPFIYFGILGRLSRSLSLGRSCPLSSLSSSQLHSQLL